MSSRLKQRKSERVADVQIWRWKSHNGLASDQRHNKETKPGHKVSVSVNIFPVPCSAMSSLIMFRRNAELRTGQHRRHSANAKNEPVRILKSGTKSLMYHWEKLYKRSTDFVHSLTACHWRGRHMRTERHHYEALQINIPSNLARPLTNPLPQWSQPSGFALVLQIHLRPRFLITKVCIRMAKHAKNLSRIRLHGCQWMPP